MGATVNRRAPHVLVLGTVFDQPMGGVRRHNQELLPRAARLLAARGGALSVLGGRQGIAFALPDVEVLAGRAPSRPLAVRAALESSAVRDAVVQAASRGKPFHLVHTAHLPTPSHCPLPLTVTIHDVRGLDAEVTALPRRLLARTALGRAKRDARLFFTVSAAIAGELQERLRIPAEHIVVCGNGGDHLQPLPRQSSPSALTKAPLLAIGHVEPRKNLAVLLHALALDPTLPPLEVHGAAKGDELDRLKALSSKLDISDRVRWCGPYEEDALPSLLARAAAVCVPSLVEGFSLVALEAQLAQAPLAVANISALRETAPYAPCFDPQDAQACAKALHAAMEQSAVDVSAAATRATAHTWDACAERLVEGWCRVAQL